MTESNFTASAQATILCNDFGNYAFGVTAASPGAHALMGLNILRLWSKTNAYTRALPVDINVNITWTNTYCSLHMFIQTAKNSFSERMMIINHYTWQCTLIRKVACVFVLDDEP